MPTFVTAALILLHALPVPCSAADSSLAITHYVVKRATRMSCAALLSAQRELRIQIMTCLESEAFANICPYIIGVDSIFFVNCSSMARHRLTATRHLAMVPHRRCALPAPALSICFANRA